MYPITSAAKALYDAEQRQVLHITGTDKNGTSINITDANVMANGFSIDRYSCIGEKIEIGTAVAAEMTLVLDNRHGQFDSVVFKGTELFVEVGIADWTQSNPTVYWMPCGYFTPDEQPRSMSIITIHALDRLANFDNMEPLTPWTTSDGAVMTDSTGNTLYFISGAKYPCTVSDMVARLAMMYGIPFTQDLSGFPNYDYTISAKPQLSQKVTSRNLLQWCAGLMGCNAYIDWTGALRFAWYTTDSGYAVDDANRFDGDLAEDDFTVTGIRYTNSEGGVILVGTDGFTVDLTGNYLLQANQTSALIALRDALVGYSYRPFTATVVNVPYLWPMDLVTYTDKDGNNHTCALTNVNFGLNSTTALASKGIGYSGESPAGVTREQGRLIEQAIEATRELDDSLDQEGIFNRLTDNGQAQGLYMVDGQLYVNMSYARAGTLILGGLNNQNGLLEVQDASGNVIGQWRSDGIHLDRGAILFPLTGSSGDGNYVALNKDGIPFESMITTQNGACRIRLNNFAFTLRDENTGNLAALSSNTLVLSDYEHNNSFFPSIELMNDKTELDVLLSPNGLLIKRKDGTQIAYLYSDGALVTGPMSVTGNLTVGGTVSAGNGASGTFTVNGGRVVTVSNGIIIGIA